MVSCKKLDVNFNILKIPNILIIPNILLIPYRSLLSPQQRYGNIPKILNILLIPIIPDGLLQKIRYKFQYSENST